MSHESQRAREELRAVVSTVGPDWGYGTYRRVLAPGTPTREAAVLILFGALDTERSDRSAEDTAVSRDLDLLLLSRASTLRSHPGQVAFPGGRIDPGDDGPVDAALREAWEETGLDRAGIEVLGSLPEVPLDYSGHVVTPVLAWWRAPSPVRVVDTAESADVFRVPVAELLDPTRRGVTVLERDGVTWRGPAFVIDGTRREYVLWGFTAIVLDSLFTRLGWTEAWDESREIAVPWQ